MHGCNQPVDGRNRGATMKLNAPSMIVFLVALALAILALIGHFARVEFITQYQFWLALLAYVVLAVGCVLKGV
jgi:hypothetical protein